MTHVTLPAHFDGEQIQLDVPYPLEPAAKLLVVVLPDVEATDEHDAWLKASTAGLAEAYGDDEPDYSSVVLREANVEYAPAP